MKQALDLTAPDLFGNDAAEDEDPAVFRAYALRRPEVDAFLSPERPICIARAYKGEGKSALLRLVSDGLSVQKDAPVVIEARGKQLSPEVRSLHTDPWVRGWKAALLEAVAHELGARIGFAWSDDAMTLVEEAERGGYRARSFVSSLLDRLKVKGAPLERVRPEVAQHERVVQRFAEREDAIWLIVDDVDENFQNTPEQRAKVASFFIAARELFRVVPQLRLRLAVRPNTWTTLSYEAEALSKVDQYCTDLRWSAEDIEELLLARVRAYLGRLEAAGKFKAERSVARMGRDEALSRVFEVTVDWNHRRRSIQVPLTTLSRRRPRWLVELCREAARAASARRQPVIALADVVGCLEPFGKRRIADTVAEFKAQCPEVEELIAAFSGQAEEYKTDELMKLIDRRVLQGLRPKIDGVPGVANARNVAAFLFEIGFLSARRQLPEGEYEHLTYTDQPDLLRSRTNVDGGVTWEIHPVFRQALDLRDSSGRRRRKPPADKRGR